MHLANRQWEQVPKGGGERLKYRIKELRERRGLMQKDLAEVAMVSKPYLHDLENNKRGAKPETLQRIANALGVDVSELIIKQEAG